MDGVCPRPIKSTLSPESPPWEGGSREKVEKQELDFARVSRARFGEAGVPTESWLPQDNRAPEGKESAQSLS